MSNLGFASGTGLRPRTGSAKQLYTLTGTQAAEFANTPIIVNAVCPA